MTFFDDDGMFRLDELVAQSHTFQKVMEDDIVTDEEVKEQSELVLKLYKKRESDFSSEQLDKIANVIVQTGVLQAISQYKELQELHK